MNKTNKGGLFTGVSLGTAAVWFSTHCGAGFASGTQELQYFSNHGWYGPLMPAISMAIVALVMYVGMETARRTEIWNYDGWASKAYDPVGRLGVLALDIGIVVMSIAATAAAIASGSELISQTIGLPVWIGAIIMFAIITLLSIFGEKVVRNNAMIMTVAILVIISIIIVLGLVKFWPNISELYSEKYVNPEATKWSITGSSGTTEGSFFNALLWALTYAGFQVGIVGAVSAAFKGATSEKESKGAALIGFVINVIMLSGICLLIFSGMPEVYTDEQARLLPTVYIVNQLDFPLLGVIYPLLLFLALITTAVGLTFGMVSRVDPYVLKKVNNPFKKKCIIAVLFLLMCYLISNLGLLWVVQVAYKYLGIFNWIFVILPLFILGFRNMKKLDNK